MPKEWITVTLEEEDLEDLLACPDGEELGTKLEELGIGFVHHDDAPQLSPLDDLASATLDPSDRYSFDAESLQVVNAEREEGSPCKGYIEALFTASRHAQCRDLEDLGDERSTTFDFEIDPATRTLIISIEVPERNTFEEF